jgi:hypothetical protein
MEFLWQFIIIPFIFVPTAKSLFLKNNLKTKLSKL